MLSTVTCRAKCSRHKRCVVRSEINVFKCWLYIRQVKRSRFTLVNTFILSWTILKFVPISLGQISGWLEMLSLTLVTRRCYNFINISDDTPHVYKSYGSYGLRTALIWWNSIGRYLTYRLKATLRGSYVSFCRHKYRPNRLSIIGHSNQCQILQQSKNKPKTPKDLE